MYAKGIKFSDTHPVVWWIWGSCLSVEALLTNNPLLLLLIAVVVINGASARGESGVFGRSFQLYVEMALWVVVVRVVFQIIFGLRVPGNNLFEVPSVTFHIFASPISIGGFVTSQAIVSAISLGIQLADLVLIFGAINAMSNPYRLLRSLPTTFFEVAMVLTVALSFAPEIAIELESVKEARKLRGLPVRGVRAAKEMALPILEGSLERSLKLSSSMEVRGYGIHREVGSRVRPFFYVALVTLIFSSIAYVVFPGVRLVVSVAAVGAVALLVANLASNKSTSRRSRYRPEKISTRGFLAISSALLSVIVFVVVRRLGGVSISMVTPSAIPLAPLGLAAIAIAALALFITLPSAPSFEGPGGTDD